MKRIQKKFQGTIPENKILNMYSQSITDTYSCDMINNLTGSGPISETDPTVPEYVKNITEDDLQRWNNNTGGITEETDPIFKSSPAYNITQNDITNWNNNTYTAGTGINISSDNVISNTITNTSQLNNDSNFINEIKTINGQSLIGQGNIVIEGGSKYLSYEIKPPADYTTADTDRISSIMLGDITPTDEDYAKYDLNGDGVIDILDLRICRSLIEYNLKSSVPGRIIIDASDYLKPIKIINSNNEIIASLGVNSSTRDLSVIGDLSVSKNITGAGNINASGNITADNFRWDNLLNNNWNDYIYNGVYTVAGGDGANSPFSGGKWGTLIVNKGKSVGEDYVQQTFISNYSVNDVREYIRSAVINSSGANWTSWIGIGGSSNEVVLYDNETGSNATITLSETSANFKYLEIFCKSGDNTHTSVKVYKPDGKRATVCSGWFGSAAYFKLSVLTISGNTIALTKNASEITGSNRCNTAGNDNAMYITRVVGYRN